MTRRHQFYKIEFFPFRSPRPPRILKLPGMLRLRRSRHFRIFSETLNFSKTRDIRDFEKLEILKEGDRDNLGFGILRVWGFPLIKSFPFFYKMRVWGFPIFTIIKEREGDNLGIQILGVSLNEVFPFLLQNESLGVSP